MKKLLLRLSLLCTMCLFALGVSAAPDKNYLCFTANEANSTVTLKIGKGNPNAVTLQTSTDGSTWNNYTIGNAITLSSKGSKVYFRTTASSVAMFSKDNNHYYQFAMTGSIAASGNVMSLVDKNCETLEIPCDCCFYNLFANCKSLTTAPELPATTLAKTCYGQMFFNCSSLTTAPQLPATTLADGCYDSMFYGCSSLTTAPQLPATTLADGCYSGMFWKSGLTTAPELPVTTLAESCYSQMFQACESLTEAPELPATTLASKCYNSMFYGCKSLTTAPELPATTLASSCYSSMFRGCENLTTAPELPVTTLAESCYYAMFASCSSLTTAPELPATTLASSCYSNMFYGCSSLNFVKAAFTKWGGTTNTDPDYNATTGWLNGVSSTGTFICPSGLDTTTRGSNTVPGDWNVFSPANTTPTSAYVGESVTFTTAGDEGVDNIKYYVKKDGGEYEPLDGNTFTPGAAGTYTVKVEATDDFFTEPMVAEIPFTVKAIPEFTTFRPTSGHVGYIYTFYAKAINFVGDPTISYYVKKDGDSYGDALVNNEFTPQEAGTYYVKAVATCAGERSAEKEIIFSVDQFSLTVSALGWASLYFNEDLVIPDNTKAYYASEQNGDVVTLIALKNYIPKNTAVIVKAEPGKYVFPFAEEDVDALEETNLFTGLLEDKPTEDVQALTANAGKSLYVLADADETDGTPIFRIYSGKTLGAYKMYLPIEGSKEARIRFTIANDDDADGIVRLTGKAAGSRMYNTLGVPVNAGYNGVILKGGKKFIDIKK